MNIVDATWTDVDETDPDVVLLPVGSTEQHGPHAPLGTDHYSAETVAETAANAADHEVLVAPSIPIGVSEEHRHFTGTLWVSPDTFRAYVRETVESMLDHGWDRIVLVNGHGGNTAPIAEVAARLGRDHPALVAPFTWFEAVDAEVPMGHAGAVETSFLLATRPELVHEDRFAEAAAGAGDRWGEWVSGVNLAVDSASFTENGVVGDPTEASEEIGNALEHDASEALQRLIAALVDRDVETSDHR